MGFKGLFPKSSDLTREIFFEEGECSEDGTTPPSPLSLVSLPISSKALDHARTFPSHLKFPFEKERNVSINDAVQVRIIIDRQDITPQECAATWFSREEYAAITRSCCKQIAKLNRGELLKDKKYCARGLDAHTRTRSLAKSMNRSLAYQAVFEEQDRQRREGIQNDVALARVYNAVNSSCQLWATVVGLDDQKEASIIHD